MKCYIDLLPMNLTLSPHFYQHHNFYNLLMSLTGENDVTYINSMDSPARVFVG